jgi:D-glycero-alpha-D-manno-heptose-7-phosphate kinase
VPLKAPERVTFRASCPARIDIGNSLDFPNIHFSLPAGLARTTNIAIDMRTSVSWSPDPKGRVSVVLADGTEESGARREGETSRCAVLWALLRHVGADSGTFRISSDVPRGSGLGGSGMLLLATLALVRVRRSGRATSREWPGLALTVHMFENWLGFSRTGFQDQLAALYGGMNTWVWGTHLEPGAPCFTRRPLRPRGGAAEMEKHLLLCYTGQPHRPTRMSRRIGAVRGRDLALWAEVSAQTRAFADAVERAAWEEAAERLNAECALRRELVPRCLSDRASRLIEAATECGLGARYAGHGHGGCVWACGPRAAVKTGMERWTSLTRCWKGAWVIAPKVARRGLIVEG